MASPVLQERYDGLDCDVPAGSKYPCDHMKIGPLLLWLQRRAWSEIRCKLALLVGRRVSPEELEMLFAAALKVEGIPRRPGAELLVKDVPTSCKLRGCIEDFLESGPIRQEDEAELFGDVDVGDENSSYLTNNSFWG
jgi:hypothetical protein